MKLQVRKFRVPKAGNKVEEYEDALAFRESGRDSVRKARLAVADGATETSFSGLWASLLCRAFVSGRLTSTSVATEQMTLERQWKRRVGSKPLPWYAEQKLESGAFAALVGLELFAEGTWNALAVGDCCLFQLRGTELETRFPLNSAEDFDSRPLLLSSLSRNNVDAIQRLRLAHGRWQQGDTFYLMSDAIAAWFLRQFDAKADPVVFIDDLRTSEDFAQFVTSQRKDAFNDGSPVMKNDDVTLLVCSIS